MKYLVCSDIHGSLGVFRKILECEKDSGIDAVIVTGDLELSPEILRDQIEEILPGIDYKSIHMVRGNCDEYSAASALPLELILEDSGHKIFITHGHRQGIPRVNAMYIAASREGCDIALFGHSHTYTDQYEDDVRFLNPGAVVKGYGKPSSYMILNIAGGRENVEAEKKTI